MRVFWLPKLFFSGSGLALATLLVSGCESSLDTTRLEKSIHEQVLQQGGKAIRTVVCPDRQVSRPGQTFICMGILESGNGVDIQVQQTDSTGNVRWEIPSVRGLLNLLHLQEAIQSDLQADPKAPRGEVRVDCSAATPYRSVSPGESFECVLISRSTNPEQDAPAPNAEKTEQKIEQKTPETLDRTTSLGTIAITITGSGEVHWQRLIPASSSTPPSNAPNPRPSPQAPSPTQAIDRTNSPESQPSSSPENPEEKDYYDS